VQEFHDVETWVYSIDPEKVILEEGTSRQAQ